MVLSRGRVLWRRRWDALWMGGCAPCLFATKYRPHRLGFARRTRRARVAAKSTHSDFHPKLTTALT